MREIAERLRRVWASKGPSYIAVRLAQKFIDATVLRVKSFPYEISLIGLPSDSKLVSSTKAEFSTTKALLRHFTEKRNPVYPPGINTPVEFKKALLSRYPTADSNAIADSQPFVSRKFQMLGQSFDFSDRPIDWHESPPGTPRWPKQHVDRINRWLWSNKRRRDWLQVWELNRHQFFVLLGRAYLLTGDHAYVREIVALTNHWIRENPYQVGMNWYSQMEISLRLISWSMTFFLIRDSEFFSYEDKNRFIKSLYQQMSYVYEHLTTHWKVHNNWLISQAVGLLVVGSLFPEFQDSNKWIQTGTELLAQEVPKQTFPDGVNAEQAAGYHHYVIDLLILVLLLARRGLLPQMDYVEDAVERMTEYALFSMNPEGRLTPIGDTDEGWGFRLTGRSDYWDLRHWLALGAVLFNRGDFKAMSVEFSEECFWLLGPDGAKAFDTLKSSLPSETSFAFPHGGHFFLRDDWTASSDYMMIRSGPFGLGGNGFCAHAHCDLLSVILWLNGRPVFVDGGTYSYDGDLRTYFRTDASHNTVSINGKNQATPKPDFSWEVVPHGQCDHFDDAAVQARVNDLNGAQVRRTVRQVRHGLWEVHDSISQLRSFSVLWSFNLAPDLDARQENEMIMMFVRSLGTVARIQCPEGVQVSLVQGWYSADYGDKTPNVRISGLWHPPSGVQQGDFTWRIAMQDV